MSTVYVVGQVQSWFLVTGPCTQTLKHDNDADDTYVCLHMHTSHSSVKVSGMLMGLSVSMGIEIEFEEGEGEMEVASPAAANDGETAGEKKSPTVTSDGDVGEDDDDDEEEEEYEEVEKEVDPAYNEPYDLGQEETPEKESAFKRTVRKGMVKAMGKVKVLGEKLPVIH